MNINQQLLGIAMSDYCLPSETDIQNLQMGVKMLYHFDILNNVLEMHISFIPQPGLSDLVCAKKITVGDALKKAYKLENVIEAIETENTGDAIDGSISDTDESLVHRTADILRRRVMNNTKKLNNEFYSCEEIGLNEQ